jgi:hypothetical protein
MPLNDPLEKAMQLMGLHMEMWTQPCTIHHVLSQMKLLDFEPEFTPMAEFLRAAKTAPQPLKPLLGAMRDGIAQGHPAIFEFIDKAVEEGWLSPAEEIQSSLHLAYLLEAFVASMANDNGFAKELRNHFYRKRAEYGVKNNSDFSVFRKVLCASKSPFIAAKFMAVDAGITSFLCSRDNDGESFTEAELDKLYREGQASFLAKKLLMPQTHLPPESCHDGIRINIYEACITEYRKNFIDNAISAHALCESIRHDPRAEVYKRGPVMPGTIDNDFYQSLSSENNVLLCCDFSEEWNRLYQTWNLAFILGGLNDVHNLFPKLLIPSVLSSSREHFMATRVFALWISIHALLFRKLDRVEEVAGPARKGAMARAWGEINKKYALALTQESPRPKSASFEKSFESFFNWPRLSLMKIIMSYYLKHHPEPSVESHESGHSVSASSKT